MLREKDSSVSVYNDGEHKASFPMIPSYWTNTYVNVCLGSDMVVLCSCSC